MFSHVTVGASDFASAKKFYDAVLPPLGLVRYFENEANGALGYSANPPR